MRADLVREKLPSRRHGVESSMTAPWNRLGNVLEERGVYVQATSA